MPSLGSRISGIARRICAHDTEGFIPLPEKAYDTTDAIIEEWLGLVTTGQNRLVELVAYPNAWHGSIDNAGTHTPAMAHHAYTFWQLDDFLARYGCPVFREVAELLRKQEESPVTPER
jgi:hypothetical protein